VPGGDGLRNAAALGAGKYFRPAQAHTTNPSGVKLGCVPLAGSVNSTLIQPTKMAPQAALPNLARQPRSAALHPAGGGDVA